MITSGTYYPNEPGARTIRESRPLYLNDQRVSVVVEGDYWVTVFIGTRKAVSCPLSSVEATSPSAFMAWAAETATSLQRAYDIGYVSVWDEPEDCAWTEEACYRSQQEHSRGDDCQTHPRPAHYHVHASGVHPHNVWTKRNDGLYELAGSPWAFTDDQVTRCTKEH